MSSTSHYFLGANSENGFVSLFDSVVLQTKSQYIIKGGPGTGKSTLMKRLAGAAAENGYETELIHCPSDPDSLDGVYIKGADIFIADGTPPHTLEPIYPGAVGHIINLYDFWDEDFLANNTANIKSLNKEISKLFERVYLYLSASGKLLRDIQKIGLSCLNKVKYKGYFERFAAKYLKPSDGNYSEEKRFISAITPKGYITFDEFTKEDRKTVVIEDDFGLAASALEIIRNRAVKNKHHVIICYSPLSPSQIQHLIIPSANLNICTSNDLCRISSKPYCKINIARFLNEEELKKHKGKLSFLRKARKSIINEAIELLENCKSKHDELEEIYKTAVDYKRLNEYTDTVINKILG